MCVSMHLLSQFALEILNILYDAESWLRPTQIIARLGARTKEKYSNASLRVIVVRHLRRFRGEGIVKRKVFGYGDVRYRLTQKGKRYTELQNQAFALLEGPTPSWLFTIGEYPAEYASISVDVSVSREEKEELKKSIEALLRLMPNGCRVVITKLKK